MTESFLPAQAFEITQLMHDLAHLPETEVDPHKYIRRTSFSIMMTATYGRRVPTWDHQDVQHMIKGREILGKVSKPGTFIEDEIPVLGKLPYCLQSSRGWAAQLAIPVHAAKMRLWKILREQQFADVAPACFGRELMMSDSMGHGLTEEDGAWIASGMSEFNGISPRSTDQEAGLVEVGTETSTITLTNLMLYLATYPKVQERALAELSDVVSDTRMPRFEDVEHLPYIRACVKEILRLHPIPTWGLKHYTDGEVSYKGTVIPKGTVVLGNTWAIHYDPSRYPNPTAFNPEHYLAHNKYAAEYAAMGDPLQRDHYAFGAGRRICPGARLAENTLNLALANLVWCFRIEPPSSEAQMDLSDEAWEDTAFRPPKPFKVRLVPRSEERLRVGDQTWAKAREEGYTLRGVRINEEGAEIR
ncbi:hypothetical protein LTR37_012102 [Vermiconidia calcicola]|uniref:Uncharacterized protein n=1 Tax=Vermiconidia calcicola TaxID=1690605 RepID=A0ACC3N1T6_9PEZI|nr:hypothetical protein LTR37_012102 [Vermiconidia calcicola]